MGELVERRGEGVEEFQRFCEYVRFCGGEVSYV